ncbi:MAG: flavin reductase [Clostridiales bacterium]|nr:flavin reductase [Clostridiales bacterium]
MDKTLFHDISYGMFIITTNYNQQNVGCIINTFCQITSEDMIVTISLNKNNFTNKAVKESKCFTVSIISENTNPDLIKKFGFYTSKDTDKFSGFEYEIISNLPVLKENTNGYFLCNVIDVVDCGTHDIFIAKVANCERLNNFTPMTYSYYHKVVKGKAPKNAPTYIEEKIEKSSAKKYKCLLCGYIYDDSKESVKFEDLNDDWTCPICGASKSYFEEI